jgi:hypothetical protein
MSTKGRKTVAVKWVGGGILIEEKRVVADKAQEFGGQKVRKKG